MLTSLIGETGSFHRPSDSALRPASSASLCALRIRAAATAHGLQLGRLRLSISSLSSYKAVQPQRQIRRHCLLIISCARYC